MSAKKSLYASSAICSYIEEYENLSFSFETSQLKVSLVGIMPIRCNTSVNKDDQGNVSEWLQIVASFTKEYTRTDLSGEQHDDNASLNTFKVKIREQSLIDNGISGEEFKAFFDAYYVGKRFVFLPTTGESPSFTSVKTKDGYRREIVPNAFETVIHPSFSIRDFMESTKKQFADSEELKHGKTPPLPNVKEESK